MNVLKTLLSKIGGGCSSALGSVVLLIGSGGVTTLITGAAVVTPIFAALTIVPLATETSVGGTSMFMLNVG